MIHCNSEYRLCAKLYNNFVGITTAGPAAATALGNQAAVAPAPQVIQKQSVTPATHPRFHQKKQQASDSPAIAAAANDGYASQHDTGSLSLCSSQQTHNGSILNESEANQDRHMSLSKHTTPVPLDLLWEALDGSTVTQSKRSRATASARGPSPVSIAKISKPSIIHPPPAPPPLQVSSAAARPLPFPSASDALEVVTDFGFQARVLSHLPTASVGMLSPS